MPRVKIDYVVSFSSEDPENQATNLLAWDVSKKKWLCNKGEPTCSVVLQLVCAVKISAVHIGAYHSALVEVLVGRSEKPNEPFQVLVPSCLFLSISDSRRGENVDKVRSFTGEQLTAESTQSRWDRIRVVCSQPYNKHCKYGLSFIHIFEPEDKANVTQNTPVPKAVPSRLFNIDNFSSDEDEFRPGELFAKHSNTTPSSSSKDKLNNTTNVSVKQTIQENKPVNNTDAQIRQSTLQALKNIQDPSARVVRSPIIRNSTKQTDERNGDHNDSTNRQRNTLMYTDDDGAPHSKIDNIMHRHNNEKKKEIESTKNTIESNDKNKDTSNYPAHKDDKVRNSNKKNDSRRDDKSKKDDSRKGYKTSHSHKNEDSRHEPQTLSNKTTPTNKAKKMSNSQHDEKESHRKKRPYAEDRKVKSNNESLRPGPINELPYTLMSHVVFALSGYVNPRRSSIRDSALAMGARFERDWTPMTTHLICAFPNTPKLKAVRSDPNGKKCVVVTAEWIEECCRRRRIVPWQWYATEPENRVTPTKEDLLDEPLEKVDSECDTDDEIEKVLHKQKRQKILDEVPSRSDQKDLLNDSDIMFIKDERFKGNFTIDDSGESTDENDTIVMEAIDESKMLPDFFDGYTFIIDENVAEDGFDEKLLKRYIEAYGGLVLEQSQLDCDSEVDFTLSTQPSSGSSAKGRRVLPDWVWRCHQDRALTVIDEYTLT